jgi:biotin carboxylase
MGQTVIIVGNLALLLPEVERVLPPGGELLVIQDPSLVERAAFVNAIAASPRRRSTPWPYPRPATADPWYHRHRDLDVLAVIPAVEYAVSFAARLAERYGVPGASFGAASLLRDKTLLRAATTAAGLRNPAYAPVSSLAEAREFAAAHPGPLILKPTNRQGSVGTRIVPDPAELELAWRQTQQQEEAVFVAYQDLPLSMQVEEFVAGTEYSVEMLVRDGVSEFANVTDKLLHPGVCPVELGHMVPADVPPDQWSLLVDATAEVMAVVGFGTGVVHCEWIVREGQPYLVECTGRLPGDGIVGLIEHAWPIDLVHRYVVMMMGGRLGPVPERPAAAAATLFAGAGALGVVEAVEGLADAAAVPGVYQSGCAVVPGQRVNELRSAWDRGVGAAATGETVAQALAAARSAVEKIVVRTMPEPE